MKNYLGPLDALKELAGLSSRPLGLRDLRSVELLRATTKMSQILQEERDYIYGLGVRRAIDLNVIATKETAHTQKIQTFTSLKLDLANKVKDLNLATNKALNVTNTPRVNPGASFRTETSLEYLTRVEETLKARTKHLMTQVEGDLKSGVGALTLQAAANKMQKSFLGTPYEKSMSSILEHIQQKGYMPKNVMPPEALNKYNSRLNEMLMRTGMFGERPNDFLNNVRIPALLERSRRFSPEIPESGPLASSPYLYSNPMTSQFTGPPDPLQPRYETFHTTRLEKSPKGQEGTLVSLDAEFLSEELLSGKLSENSLKRYPQGIAIQDTGTGKVVVPAGKGNYTIAPLRAATNVPLLKGAAVKEGVIKAVYQLINKFAKLSPKEALDVMTFKYFKKFIISALGPLNKDLDMKTFDVLLKALYKNTINFLEAQDALGGRVIETTYEQFIGDVLTFLTDDTPNLMTIYNSPHLQRAAAEVDVANMIESYFEPRSTADGKDVSSVASVIDRGPKKVLYENRDLSLMYGDIRGNIGERTLFYLVFEVHGFKDDPRYNHIWERFLQTGEVFVDQAENVKRKNLERISKRAGEKSLAEALDRIEQMNTDPIEKLPDRLFEQAEFLQDSYEAIAAHYEYRGEPVPKNLTDLQARNLDIVESLNDLNVLSLQHSSVSRTLRSSEGYNTVQQYSYNALVNMEPLDLARYLYNHTPNGIKIISKDSAITSNREFSNETVSLLRSKYKVKVAYEDDSIIIFKADMSFKDNFKPLEFGGHPSYDEVSHLYTREVYDSLLEIAELNQNTTEYPLSMLYGGGVTRVNGELLSEYLRKLDVFTEEELLDLEIGVQYNSLTKSPILAGPALLSEIFGENPFPRTLVGAITSTMMSLTTHNASKFLFTRHFLNPDFFAGNILGETPEIALHNYRTHKEYRIIKLIDGNRIELFEPQNIADMKYAIDKKLMVTTYPAMVELYKKLDTRTLPAIVLFFERYVTPWYKAGYFMSLGMTLRNMIDTAIRSFMVENMTVSDFFTYLYKAFDLMHFYSKHIINIDNLNDTVAINKYMLSLPIEDQKKFLIMGMLVKAQISGTPLEHVLDITMTKRLREVELGVREEVASWVQEFVWNMPIMKQILTIVGKTESLFRTALALFKLDQGKHIDEIISSNAAQFVDYAFKSPDIRMLNAFIPFSQFAFSNAALWADQATVNPSYLKMLLRVLARPDTRSNEDEESENRNVGYWSKYIQGTGRIRVGDSLVNINPSLFDALSIVPGMLTNPMQRMNPVIRNTEALLRGDISAIEMPYESAVGRATNFITDTIPSVLAGNGIKPGQILPSMIRDIEEPNYSGLYRSRYNKKGANYNVTLGRGSRMDRRYGSRLGRSSLYPRKATASTSLYNSLYTKGGLSRMKLNASPTTAKNLKYKIADLKYRFR